MAGLIASWSSSLPVQTSSIYAPDHLYLERHKYIIFIIHNPICNWTLHAHVINTLCPTETHVNVHVQCTFQLFHSYFHRLQVNIQKLFPVLLYNYCLYYSDIHIQYMYSILHNDNGLYLPEHWKGIGWFSWCRKCYKIAHQTSLSLDPASATTVWA